MSRLGLELLPRFSIPYAVIATVYPNADAETVDQDVTTLIEAVVSTAAGVRRVDSLSVENASLAVVEFDPDADVQPALEEIRSRLGAISFLLPSGARPPAVLPINPSQLPVMVIGLSGDDLLALTDIALDHIGPRLERVAGVGQAVVVGGLQREVEVLYHSDRLHENGLTPAWLQQMITLQHVSVPAGTLESDGLRYTARVGRPLADVDELAELVIGEAKRPQETYGLGALVPQLVRVGDVADVKEAVIPRDGIVRVDGKPGLVVRIIGQSGANAVQISRGVRDALAELAAAHPHVEMRVLSDQANVIVGSLRNLAVYGAAGAVLAALVLFLFVRSALGVTLIATAIPLSVLLTAVGLYARGMTLNVMTLAGIGLATGMVLDNAIIVFENIYRLRKEGVDAQGAAIRGAQEVFPAIVAATVTTLVVFVPVFFVRGLVGHLLYDLGVTVSLALAASLLVSVIVVPAFSVRLFRHERSAQAVAVRWDRAIAFYERLLQWSLNRKSWVLAVSAAVVLLSVPLWLSFEREFLPATEEAGIHLQAYAPAGTPAEETARRIEPLERGLLAIPEVTHVILQAGDPGAANPLALLSEARADTGTLYAGMDLRRTGRSAEAVRADVERIIAGLDGVTVRTVPDRELGPVGDTLADEVIVRIAGPDIATLRQLAEQAQQALQAVDGVTDVRVSPRPESPRLLVDIHRDRALLGGLTSGQIGLALRHAITGEEVATLRLHGRPVPVRVRPHPSELTDVDALMNFKVSSPVPMMNGEARPVRLANVSHPEIFPGEPGIRRADGQRMVEIRVAMEGGDARHKREIVANALQSALTPPDNYVTTFAGVHTMVEDTFQQLGGALLLALVAVYMVLAARYESWVHPFVIMTGVPLAAVGAAVASHAAGVRLGTTSLLGLIMLGGLVVNNGIVLIDYIEQRRKEGMPLVQAIISGSALRLRPILMTAVTTLLGVLPLALAVVPGTEIQRPMAVAVGGGLFSSTLLTLFVVPCLYMAIVGRGRRSDRSEGPSGAPGKAVRGVAGAIIVAAVLTALGTGSVHAAADDSGTVTAPLAHYRLNADLADMKPGSRVQHRWHNTVPALLDGATDSGPVMRFTLSTDWFRPISIVGYQRVKGDFLLSRTGGDEARAMSLQGRNVMGNMEANWSISFVDGDLGILPLHTASGPSLLHAPAPGMYQLRGELRQAQSPDHVWVRDAVYSQPISRRSADEMGFGQGGLLVTSGSEIRAGEAWLIGKAGVLVTGDEVLPVVRAGTRLRSAGGSRFELGVSTATEFSRLPAFDLRIQGAGERSVFTALRAEYDEGTGIVPSVFLGVDASAYGKGTGWQLLVRGNERYLLGITTSF